jgi:hypothetical protein
MTSCTSRSGERYESSMWFDAECRAGVRYSIRRVSFGRRIELVRRIRDIGRKVEFLEAGSDAREKLEAAVLAAEIDRAYVEWGLIAIEGLEIDGEPATVDGLIEKGPVDLAAEILGRIKAQCALTDSERKNLSSHSIFRVRVKPGGDATSVDGRGWKRRGGADGLRKGGGARRGWYGLGGARGRRSARNRW